MIISKRVLNLGDLTSKIESDHSTLSLATYLVEYPDSNLRTDDIKHFAQAWGQRRSHTAIESFFSASLLPQRLDYVAVFGINRPSPTIAPAFIANLLPNEARLIIDAYGLQSVHRPLVNSTGFSTSNLTGTFDILNQIINPPETPITGGYAPTALNAINDAVDTVINLQFNNNSARPYSGTQEVLIHARDSVDNLEFPNLTVVLRQGGVDIATLALAGLERTSIVGVGTLTPLGGIYRYTFNSSALTSPTSPIQLRITGETTGARSVDFLAVALIPSVAGTLFDSGWQDLATLGAGGDRVSWSPRFDFPTANGHYVIVQFSDYGLQNVAGTVVLGGTGPTVNTVAISTIGDPFKAGRFAAGSGLDLPLREQGVKLQKSGNNLGNLLSSRGGTLRSSRIDQTKWDVGLSTIPQSQARVFSEIETFWQSIGAITPAVYVLGDSDNDHTDMVPAFFALLSSYELTDVGLLLGADYPGQDPFNDKRFEISLGITEATSYTHGGQ